LSNESRHEYDAMLNALAGSIKPTNPMEWLLVRNVSNMFWEERRLERCKSEIIHMTWKDALVVLLESILDGNAEERRRAAEEHGASWLKNEEDARQQILVLVGRYDLSIDSIAAQAMTLRLPEIEMIDRRLDRLRITKMAMLREIEHYRGAGTWQLPKDLPQIVDTAANSAPLVPKLKEVTPTQ
jgi:hypothetical protein